MKCIFNLRQSRPLLFEVIAFFAFVIAFFSVGYLFHVRMQNELLSTAPYLDMVGRQRMLTQRMAYLALKARGGTAADRADLKSAMAQFDSALAFLREKDFAANKPFGDALRKEAGDWTAYKAVVARATIPDRVFSGDDAAALEVSAANLLLRCEEAAYQLKLHTEERLNFSRRMISLFLLLSFAMTLLAIYRVQTGLVTPIRAMADLSAEIASGRFPEVRVMAPPNELGVMVRNFCLMRDSMNRSLLTKTAINDLLSLSLEPIPLDALLSRLLDNLLTSLWPGLEGKGAIFLAEPGDGTLVLRAQKGLPTALREKCARVPSGHCLCGRAAASRQVVFAGGVDNRHETTYQEMPPHGHYCVPMISDKRTLGVFTVYTEEGHKEDKDTVFFLQSIAGILSGIIQRRLAEEEKALLSDVLEQAFDAVIITGTDGKIRYVNRAFERLTGYARAEAVDRTPAILKGDGMTRESDGRLWEAITSGNVWTQRVTNKRKDGRPLKMDCVIFPVKDGTGAIIAFASVQRDVTEQDALEAQLIQAQKMETLGKLSGGVAHDFNNVLGAILGYTEMLLRAQKGDRQLTADLQEIKKAADRGAGITRQLLAFSRKSRPEMRSLDLNALILDMQKMLSRLAGENIEFMFDLARDLQPLRADPVQLEQIIMNLVVNARDAIAGNGSIFISTFAETLPGTQADTRTAVISVRDTGQGMSEEVLARIGDPFFTTKGEGKGTGLGLSVVYNIARQHGGSVTVSSAPGKGSTFNVRLPLKTGTEPEGAGAAAPEAPRGHGERVWIVEDDEQLRKHLSRLLSYNGYREAAYARAEEALAASAAGEPAPDVLVTDLTLPGMNGYELAKTLMGSNGGRVLYITGYSQPLPREYAEAAKGSALLQKPFESDKLLLAIAGVLNRS